MFILPYPNSDNNQIKFFIEIGFEGTRYKQFSIIDKIVSKNRLMDKEGNIFDRNGIVYRKKGSWIKQAKDKIASARQLTEKEYKVRILQFVSKQLKEVDYTKSTPCLKCVYLTFHQQ